MLVRPSFSFSVWPSPKTLSNYSAREESSASGFYEKTIHRTSEKEAPQY